MKLNKTIILLYAITAVIEIFGEVLENTLIIYCSKPLLMILLMALLGASVKMKAQRENWLMLLALVFCLLGDVALMFRPPTESLFLIGLIAFLCGHLFYLSAFYLETRTGYLTSWKIKDMLIPILIVAHSVLVGTALYMHMTGTLKFAVLGYIFVVTSMGVAATLRTRDGFSLDRISVLAGAVLFIMSDSLIGINRFVEPDIPFVRPVIMLLYILGQFLIVLGWASRKTGPIATTPIKSK